MTDNANNNAERTHSNDISDGMTNNDNKQNCNNTCPETSMLRKRRTTSSCEAVTMAEVRRPMNGSKHNKQG